jgi:NADH:ubiquinone oxidoreductase subunit 3 (subunit A)
MHGHARRRDRESKDEYESGNDPRQGSRL